jgi:energy-converting hydrogenase B subunit D
MTLLQIAALSGVAIGGSAVVLARDPLRQVLVLSVFGMSLVMLFFVFQAPDVALSEIVVGMVGVPLMVVLALAKMGNRG